MGDDSITSETLSVYDDPRPFKSEAYLQKMGANGAPVASRRNKTLKQILNQERDLFLQQRNAEEGASKRLKTDEVSADAMDVDPPKPLPRNVLTCTCYWLTQTQVSRPLRACCLRKSTVTSQVLWYVRMYLR